MNGETGNLKMMDVGVVDVADCMEKIQKLRGIGEQGDGWEQIVNEPTGAIFMKPDGNDRAIRCTIELDVTADQAIDMFTTLDEEALTWMDRTTSRKKVKDWGPEDCVIETKLDVPWAMKYLTGIPETIYLRFIQKRNWPNQGDHAYCCIPYDMEKGQCCDQVGMLKIKSGVISPHPENPDKCILVSLDSMTPGMMMPDFALKAMMKSKATGPVKDMIVKFKKSQFYANSLNK